MRPAPFKYVKPATLAELRHALAGNDGSRKIIAGGQSLVPMMNFRMAAPSELLDINGLRELDYIRKDGNVLRIGALARHNRILESEIVRSSCPLLAQAYHHVAHHTVRNRGTLGGNVCHADPASEMPAALLALEAVFHVDGRSRRAVPATDFFRGVYTTAVGPDEFLAEIEVPLQTPGRVACFDEVSLRKGDFAICGTAVIVSKDGGVCRDARIAYCGIADLPFRLREAERWLEGRPATAATAKACGELAATLVDPMDDVKASSTYRRQLTKVLTTRILEHLFENE